MRQSLNIIVTEAAKREKKTPAIHKKKIFPHVYSTAKIFVLCLFNLNAQGYVIL